MGWHAAPHGRLWLELVLCTFAKTVLFGALELKYLLNGQYARVAALDLTILLCKRFSSLLLKRFSGPLQLAHHLDFGPFELLSRASQIEWNSFEKIERNSGESRARLITSMREVLIAELWKPLIVKSYREAAWYYMEYWYLTESSLTAERGYNPLSCDPCSELRFPFTKF
jgi:hypothetical protein